MKSNYELVELKFGPLLGYEGNTELYVCPNCTHTLRVTRDKGLLNCFFCGYGKGLRLDKYYKSETNNRKNHNPNLPDFCTKLFSFLKLTEYERTYLKSRGIPNPSSYGLKASQPDLQETLLNTFSKEYLEANGIIEHGKLSYALHSGRILIPYYTLYNGLVGLKSRSTPYLEILKPNTLRYTSLKGSSHGQHLYKPARLNRNSTLILTEGEFKAIACSMRGYNTLAIPGISFSLNSFKEFKKVSKHFKYNYIILDNDKNFEKTRVPSEAYLKLCTVENTIPVILPKSSSQSKIGLDDYLNSNEDDFQDLLEESYWKKEKTLNYLTEISQSIKYESSISRNL